ncbi:hypothetical protein pipiens_019874, partial [Culex pipiens pipiens]
IRDRFATAAVPISAANSGTNSTEKKEDDTMMAESDNTAEATRRLNVKKQTLDDAYAIPANFLEIDVVNPLTTLTAAKKRYTDYEVRMRTGRYPQILA